MKNESQLDNIRNSIVAVGIDPTAKTGKKETVFEFVSQRVFDVFVDKSEARLDDRIPLAGVHLTVRNVFDLLDKRRFTDKAGRPVVTDLTRKAKSYSVTIKGDVRLAVDAEAERRNVKAGKVLQKIVAEWAAKQRRTG